MTLLCCWALGEGVDDAKYVDHRLVESRATRVYCCCWVVSTLACRLSSVSIYITVEPSRVFSFSHSMIPIIIFTLHTTLSEHHKPPTVAIQNKNVKCCKLNKKLIELMTTTIDYRSNYSRLRKRSTDVTRQQIDARESLALQSNSSCWHFSTSLLALSLSPDTKTQHDELSIKAAFHSTTFDNPSPFIIYFFSFTGWNSIFTFTAVLSSQVRVKRWVCWFSYTFFVCVAWHRAMSTEKREVITRFIRVFFSIVFKKKISFHLLNGTRGIVSKQIE